MIEDILSRLSHVRQTGPDRWIASCPTREDKRPSMTIRELADGRVLLHDFGGDSTAEILDVLGLDWSALFPENPDPQGKPAHRPFPAMDVLRCIVFEALLVLIAANAVKDGTPLSPLDRERLAVACGRLQSAVDVAGGARYA